MFLKLVMRSNNNNKIIVFVMYFKLVEFLNVSINEYLYIKYMLYKISFFDDFLFILVYV